MPNSINPAFQQALREIGRPTTPEDLRRRGVQRLRSVSTSAVSLLIERAVNRTLMERTIGPLDPAGLADVLKSAEAQLTLQLREFHDLADSRQVVEAHRRETQAELARLRASLAERRRAETRPAALTISQTELRQRLALEIRACLAGPQAEDELLAVAERHIAEAEEELRRGFKLETENHERRVAKLVKSLEETEKVLARVAAAKGVEQGVESIFRSVQGLSTVDGQAEQKRELLVRIFEANMALRQAREATAQFA